MFCRRHYKNSVDWLIDWLTCYVPVFRLLCILLIRFRGDVPLLSQSSVALLFSWLPIRLLPELFRHSMLLRYEPVQRSNYEGSNYERGNYERDHDHRPALQFRHWLHTLSFTFSMMTMMLMMMMMTCLPVKSSMTLVTGRMSQNGKVSFLYSGQKSAVCTP